MAASLSDNFSDGKRFLLEFGSLAIIETNAGEKTSPVTGEVIIDVHGDHATNRGLSLARFALVGSSVDARRGATGVISVIGKSANGIIEATEQDVSVRVEIDCEINYESLDRALVSDMEEAHYYIPATEPAAGRVSGRLLEDGDSVVLADCRIEIVCAAEEVGEIQLIVVEPEPLSLSPLFPVRERLRGTNNEDFPIELESNTDANVCIQVNQRRLIVQPVGFRSSAADTNPSGSTATAQFNRARQVWSKSCIDIQVNPMHIITDATLKTSSDLTAIRNSYTHSDPNVIEVFFVANSLPSIGGGSAGGIGVASCKVVVAEPNAGNPVLMAHELGHVLSLLHPGSGSNSDAGTVMQPTGSASNPGTEFVTHFMSTNTSNPVLQTLPATLCCLTHDIGDHYIRDFPVDVGAEPSDPLPAGMTRYLMSSVWNRLTNTSGAFNASTGPEHQHPVRFNTNMTPRTNYLFARVEQRANLKVRNAVVKFYVKNPGSGGGAANLHFIGQAPVSDTLGVGIPQTVSIPWTIPAGTPQHSCVFAVVRSDAEPEGDQSALDWWQFEALSRNDNDWAQRNLDIQNVASGNVGEDNNVESAPFIIRVPPQHGYEELRLDLDVDARGAEGLTALTLEVPGKERFELEPGEQLKITPETPIVPNQDFIVIVQANIPGGLSLGRSFTINVDPAVEDRDLVGFAAEFRVSRPKQVLAQFLDTTAAAFVDMSELAELPFAHSIARECRALLREPPYTLNEMARVLVRFESLIEAGESELEMLLASQAFGVIEAMASWRKMVAKFEEGEVSALAIIEGFRKISGRLVTTAAILADNAELPSPTSVQVVLDRIEIGYDHDLLGPGEFYFLSEVKSEDGHVVKRRLPTKGHYIVDAGCKTAILQLDSSIYEGKPGNALRVSLEGREVDLFGKEDTLCSYERQLTGGPDSIRGSYVPRDEELDPEKLKDWNIYFRVV